MPRLNLEKRVLEPHKPELEERETLMYIGVGTVVLVLVVVLVLMLLRRT
jgi:hypothetical protein